MQLAAADHERNYLWRMPEKPVYPPVSKRVAAMSETMQHLRRRAGDAGKKLAAQAAADRIGITRQTWDNWERGSQVILREDVQDQIATALGVSREKLRHEYQRRLGETIPAEQPGVAEAPARALVPLQGLPRLLMPDDHLRPWAYSGQTIVYDPQLWPREGHGCVVQQGDRLAVKIFVRADAESFHLRELEPPRDFTLPRDSADAYQVVARLG